MLLAQIGNINSDTAQLGSINSDTAQLGSINSDPAHGDGYVGNAVALLHPSSHTNPT
jgi:hypothetical protein